MQHMHYSTATHDMVAQSGPGILDLWLFDSNCCELILPTFVVVSMFKLYESMLYFRKLMDGLRCIDDFTTKCLDEDHRAYFNTLYTGTTQVIMDLCKTGEYQTEYLKHARCMRNAQTEYESCVDIYQLRIKSLNKVSFRNSLIVNMSTFIIAGRDLCPQGWGGQCAGALLQLPALPPLQRAGGQLHLRRPHRRLHQAVPGPDVGAPGAAALPALRARERDVPQQGGRGHRPPEPQVRGGGRLRRTRPRCLPPPELLHRVNSAVLLRVRVTIIVNWQMWKQISLLYKHINFEKLKI